jgi:hypothetical protein
MIALIYISLTISKISRGYSMIFAISEGYVDIHSFSVYKAKL